MQRLTKTQLKTNYALSTLKEPCLIVDRYDKVYAIAIPEPFYSDMAGFSEEFKNDNRGIYLDTLNNINYWLLELNSDMNMRYKGIEIKHKNIFRFMLVGKEWEKFFNHKYY